MCVDSPLANEATKIFSGDLRGYLDEDALELVKAGDALFTFPGLMMTESSEESKMLNMDKSSKVIISASGMCDAGRIRHHLKHNLWREECSIVFVGYQGEGTLGRRLLEGVKQVKLFGEDIAVNAKIYNFKGLSSHADRDHLWDWIDHVKPVKPQQVFVVHGDAPVTEIFANSLREKGYNAHAPLYEEVFDLANNVMLAAGVEISQEVQLRIQRTHVLCISGIGERGLGFDDLDSQQQRGYKQGFEKANGAASRRDGKVGRLSTIEQWGYLAICRMPPLSQGRMGGTR